MRNAQGKDSLRRNGVKGFLDYLGSDRKFGGSGSVEKRRESFY